VKRASVSIEVTVDAEALLSGSRDWKHSKLSPSHGKIDLIKTLEEFHIQIVQNYATYVVRTFYPELLPASEFYGQLAEEVRARDPFARMYFLPEEPKSTKDGHKTTIEFKYSEVPNDLFTELNIRVIKKTPEQPAES
jgi:hypothetical protein